MFEYINRETVGIFILGFTNIGFLKAIRKSAINWDLRAYAIFLVFFAIYSVYDAKSCVENNIKSLKDGARLKCSIDKNQYLVSMKEGWRVDKNYFVKDSLLIRADKCTQFEE